jgi:hypothetical protein
MSPPVLQSYLDESADEQRKNVFCVGGCLASDLNWTAIEKAWTGRLAADSIAYFRATDYKAVKGPFSKLRSKCGSLAVAMRVAEGIRADLERILLSFH